MNFKILLACISLLTLCNCNQNRRANDQRYMDKQIFISDLNNVLSNLNNGKLDHNFFGITSNGVDCIYFVNDEAGLNIEYEVMIQEQKKYYKSLVEFAKNNHYNFSSTTYRNKPQYQDAKYAPVLRLEINANLKEAEEIGVEIMNEVFKNDALTKYNVVP